MGKVRKKPDCDMIAMIRQDTSPYPDKIHIMIIYGRGTTAGVF